MNTKLRPRSKRGPSIIVKGVEGQHYIVGPVDESASNFTLDSDQIAASYICGDLSTAIHHESEQSAWARLSRETFDLRLSEPEAGEVPVSPEDVFAAAEQ